MFFFRFDIIAAIRGINRDEFDFFSMKFHVWTLRGSGWFQAKYGRGRTQRTFSMQISEIQMDLPFPDKIGMQFLECEDKSKYTCHFDILFPSDRIQIPVKNA